MIKVSPRVEKIFAHAVALEQAGRMRNTVFCIQNRIYILNFDHTVLLRFLLNKTEKPFSKPVAFRANDYDGRTFWEEDGKIVFQSEQGGYERRRICLVPDRTPEDVEALWRQLSAEERDAEGEWIPLPKTLTSLLEPELSHVEFIGEAGSPVKIVQRDIYSGSKIEIQESKKSLIANNIPFGFGPIAVRTTDLLALYSFQDVIYVRFQKKGQTDFIKVKSRESFVPLEGIVGCCLYDEMFETKGLSDGREESKIRRSK